MKRAQRGFNWSWLWGLLTVTLGICIWQSWAWWNAISAPPQAITSAATDESIAPTVRMQIPPGTATQQIGQELEAAGLIRSSTAWSLWARWLQLQDPQGEFKAGTYQLSPRESLAAIADKIWHGKVAQQSITIPEGWSLQQMATYLEEQGFFPAAEFLAATHQIPRDQFPWLPANLPHLEGFLYPDTYQINSGRVTPQAVIQQMLQRFEQVALPLYQQNQDKTEFDLLHWVTLASIVEKEAVIPAERALIAGVFIARLQRDFPLGADPTVEYALSIRQTPDQPLTLEQVNTPSPYNTYRNRGLPPTPIASPGIASLQAVLEPEETPYLYFVARYDGSHVFSRTLEEHNAAQAAIRRQQAERQKQ